MTPNLTNLQTRFKKLGKLIYVSQLGPTHAVAKKTLSVTTVDQASTTDATEEFDVLDQVVAPITAALKSCAAADSKLTTTIKSTVTKFLQSFVVKDLNLAAGASLTTIGTSLIAAMNSASATVAPSGSNGSNSTGFAMYFATNFGIVLPQNASPSIPDSYIASAIQ